MDGNFSLFDLHVFGKGNGCFPTKVSGLKVSRDANDKRIFRFASDKQKNSDEYILRWGVQKDKLIHSVVVYDNKYEARYFNRDSEYFFFSH